MNNVNNTVNNAVNNMNNNTINNAANNAANNMNNNMNMNNNVVPANSVNNVNSVNTARNTVSVDLNIDGETLSNVEAIETGKNLNVNTKNNMGSNNLIANEKTGWRSKFFTKDLCEGIIENKGDGNIEVTGKLKILNKSAKVIYWAANPPDFGVSFSGSGLPFPSPEVAFQNTKNIGAVKANNGIFKIKLSYPSAYYVALGSLYVPPHLHIKICEEGINNFISIKIGAGIPYRTLTHPAPPSLNPRVDATFYNNEELTVRSQEQILRDGGYPEYGTIPPEIPSNFWGKRPPR